MRTWLLLVSIAVAASAVGVASAATHSSRSTVTVKSSKYGRILFDGRGFALYAFTRDPRDRSVCRGACAAAWPPYVIRTPPRADAGVESSLLGTVRRSDGRLQVTYARRPLYYYVGDR